MERLSGLDASFLYVESPNVPLHVCSVVELDTSTIPGGYSYRATPWRPGVEDQGTAGAPSQAR